jgi:ribose transport system substrate-binding protein
MNTSLLRLSRLVLACLVPLASFAAPPTYVLVPRNDHAFYNQVFEGFSAAAEFYGVTADRANADQSVAGQVKVMQELIARKVDGIALCAVEDAGLTPVIDQATRAGIKVITFDAPAPSSSALTYIGTNNLRAGFEAGQRMAAIMKGRGTVGVLQGGLEAKNLNERAKGFRRGMAKFGPRIKVLPTVDAGQSLDSHSAATEAILRRHPEVNGVFSVTSLGPAAAAATVAKLGRPRNVLVAGFDDLSDTLKGIRNGSIAFCVVQQPFKIGWLSVDSLMDAQKGQRLDKIINTRVIMVNSKNVETYLEDMKKGLRK